MKKQLLVLLFIIFANGFADQVDKETNTEREGLRNQPTALSDFGNITGSTICAGLKPFAILAGCLSTAVFFWGCTQGSNDLVLIPTGLGALGLFGAVKAFSSARQKCSERVSCSMKGIEETTTTVASFAAYVTVGLIGVKAIKSSSTC